ncbi:MAG: polysaccharide deacetylase family protein [Spirochaetales bacterium]|nr:polysaccharide deacetylase family protein [Spirochaetales bacterium]
MKNIRFCLTVLFLFIAVSVYADLAFEPVAVTQQNDFLFRTVETIGQNTAVHTLYHGSFSAAQGKAVFEALSYYPENLIYAEKSGKIYIQNKTGLYVYDLAKKNVKTIGICPGMHKGDEYPIYRPEEAAVSPNDRFVLSKNAVSPTKANLTIYDIQTGKSKLVSENAEIKPGKPVALWSNDSNYFIYQKNGSAYYYSMTDYRNKKQLSEESRKLGEVNLDNILWTDSNYLIWIENNLIWLSDPAQFFARSIYKNYLRQGEIIGKLPFELVPATDKFIYNELSKKFLIVKDGNAIYYYSLNDDMQENPYLKLDDNARYDKSLLFNNGNALFTTKVITDGTQKRRLYLVKKTSGEIRTEILDTLDLSAVGKNARKQEIGETVYKIKEFVKPEFADAKITTVAANKNGSEILVCCDKGAFCYEYGSEELLWAIKNEPVVSAVCLSPNKWIVGGHHLIYHVDTDRNINEPIIAGSVDDAGYIGKNGVGIVCNQDMYLIDPETKTLHPMFIRHPELTKQTGNGAYRLLTRDIHQGFYRQSLAMKQLATGKEFDIIGMPKLRYKLYQPELESDDSYLENPAGSKYEVALVFDCIKTGEGMFPILSTLADYRTDASFFINGMFIDINRKMTKELSCFPVEIGNMFQFYINLTTSDFLIDKNFIRQGLSTNEEKYFNVTGRNFVSYWHAPFHAINQEMIQYGRECGYTYVSYNLDSRDGLDKRNPDSQNLRTNSELTLRLLENLKPGQIINLSTGKNYNTRDEWLYDDLDLVICELLRSGYTLTTVSDIMRRYRK